MNILGKLGILFGVCLVGEAVSKILPFPFPGSIVSMMILLVLMLAKVIKVKYIEEPAQFLLSNLLFFFIPSGVSIIRYYDLIKDNIVAIFIICVATTILTFSATAYTIKFVIWFQRRMARGDVR